MNVHRGSRGGMSWASEHPGFGSVRRGERGGIPVRDLWADVKTSLSSREAMWKEADKKAVWIRRYSAADHGQS